VTLAEFLLARIAEDEAEAAYVPVEHQDEPGLSWWGEYGHLSIAPSRVLAECAAKRRIVEQYRDNTLLLDSVDLGYQNGLEWVVATLALAHADHPDYDERWRP
jgi:hypothetical protein